jgi:coiled-coil domain-containing protein 78
MGEMKAKFNDLIKAKAELQSDLITSEEEKLKVSKALIELQIDNTAL